MAGMDEGRIHSFATPEEVWESLEDAAEEGDWVLIKGSRRMRMERVVEGLIHRPG
jgi:UDP-N-acetylmuramoyl-tripeptide--D-alanyl-D-alanine ligase